jgi:hypothetical protein
MTPAFFRRWLKRETETAQHGYVAPGAASMPTASKSRAQPAQARLVANGTGPPGTALPVDNPYHTFVAERAKQLLRRASETPQEEATRETTS